MLNSHDTLIEQHVRQAYEDYKAESGKLAYNDWVSQGMPEVLPQEIRRLAEGNITDTGETMGHFPGYITKANSRGASYFDIGDAWNHLNDEQRWAANRHFLDTIAARGDQVNLSLPKQQIRPGSWLEKETKYLIETKGYVWVNQWTLRPKR